MGAEKIDLRFDELTNNPFSILMYDIAQQIFCQMAQNLLERPLTPFKEILCIYYAFRKRHDGEAHNARKQAPTKPKGHVHINTQKNH